MAGGGIEAMICGLANEMVKKEDVTVCSIFKPKTDDIFWNKLDKKVHSLFLGKTKKGVSLKEIFKIFFLLKNGKYDVVNVHGFFHYFAFSVLLLHQRIRFFYTVHSDAYQENTYWEKKLLWLKHFCFSRGWVRPITISEASKESFTDLYRVSSKLIYNGVKLSTFENLTLDDLIAELRKHSDVKIFIHAGRISPLKNQLVLCRVFKRLIDEGENVALLIVGINQNETIFQSLKPFFTNRIIYLGERSDVVSLMSQSDAMCLSSIFEGLPVTLLEALSVGCVPICSPVGGIPEVIEDGSNGFLSSSSNEDDYYRAIKRFLALSEAEFQDMKSNCQKSFYRFDIRNTAEEYLNYYEQA
jgi:glycosyltransferase involved in cell wall biosynthesis